MIGGFRAQARLLSGIRCPVDARIETFLRSHFASLSLPFELKAARPNGDARPARHRAGTVAAGRQRCVQQPAAHQLPTSQRRAAQPAKRSSHYGRHLPRCRRRPAGAVRQVRGAAAGVRRAVPPRGESAGRAACDSVHAISPSRPRVRVAAAAADGVPRRAERHAGENDGGAILRAGLAGQQPRLCRKHLR